jgi:hypothetical protein
MCRLPNRLTSGFEVNDQIADLSVRFPCYAGSVQGYYFIGGPSYCATAQAHWFRKEPLCNAQVDRATGSSSACLDGRESQYCMRHFQTSLSDLGMLKTQISWAIWAIKQRV